MLPCTAEWDPIVLSLSVCALLVHQIFRRFETSDLPFHVFLLLVPPAIAYSCSNPARAVWSAISELAFCYTMYLGVLITSILLYRLSPFHPLYRYPGPVLCRTSMFWHVIRTTDGKQMVYLRSLHSKYGDIVRIGPNHLSIRDASLVPPLLGQSGLPRAATYKGASMSETAISFIGIQDIEEHARRRRPWTRGLAPTALKGYGHVMSHRVPQLINVLEQQQGAVMFSEWISYFAYDFMSDMVFGGGSEQMQEGDDGNYWAALEKGQKISFQLSQLPWLGIYLGYILGVGGPAKRTLEQGRAKMSKRVARGTSAPDLLYYLSNDDLPGERPPPEHDLIHDSAVAMVAGSDPTSSTLTSIFHCLLSHPAAYTALQEEVNRFYPQGEDVCNPASHRDMHYLTAVINEALRLYPAAPTSSARQVPHDAAPVVLGSVVLPPGTNVYVPPYVLHRDARNFVFPDAFWPERWLIASGRLSLDSDLARPPSASTPSSDSSVNGNRVCAFEFVHNDAAFIPFSYGPMGCVGKGFAMLQMRTVVCALLQRFRIRLGLDGWVPEKYDEEFTDYLMANRPEFPVVLEPRRL